MLFYSWGHFPDPSSHQRLLYPRTSPVGREQSPSLTFSPTPATPIPSPFPLCLAKKKVSSFAKATAEASRCVFPLPQPAPSVRGGQRARGSPSAGRGEALGDGCDPHPLTIYVGFNPCQEDTHPLETAHPSAQQLGLRHPPPPADPLWSSPPFSVGSFSCCRPPPPSSRRGVVGRALPRTTGPPSAALPVRGSPPAPGLPPRCHPLIVSPPPSVPVGKISSIPLSSSCPMSVGQQEPTPSLEVPSTARRS